MHEMLVTLQVDFCSPPHEHFNLFFFNKFYSTVYMTTDLGLGEVNYANVNILIYILDHITNQVPLL